VYVGLPDGGQPDSTVVRVADRSAPGQHRYQTAAEANRYDRQPSLDAAGTRLTYLTSNHTTTSGTLMVVDLTAPDPQPEAVPLPTGTEVLSATLTKQGRHVALFYQDATGYHVGRWDLDQRALEARTTWTTGTYPRLVGSVSEVAVSADGSTIGYLADADADTAPYPANSSVRLCGAVLGDSADEFPPGRCGRHPIPK
jgi:hypothetical protein